MKIQPEKNYHPSFTRVVYATINSFPFPVVSTNEFFVLAYYKGIRLYYSNYLVVFIDVSCEIVWLFYLFDYLIFIWIVFVLFFKSFHELHLK